MNSELMLIVSVMHLMSMRVELMKLFRPNKKVFRKKKLIKGVFKKLIIKR